MTPITSSFEHGLAIHLRTPDLILRSSDDSDFHVHQTALAVFSPVFSDILSLPAKVDDVKDGLPVVSVSECENILNIFLRLCYRRKIPRLLLSNLEHVLSMYDKYAVSNIPLEITSQLESYVEDHPLHTYAIACRHKLYEIANRAAGSTLRRSIMNIMNSVQPEYLELMTIEEYHRLICYRIRAGEVALRAIESFPSFEEVDLDEQRFGRLPGTRDSTESCQCSMESWLVFRGPGCDGEGVFIVPWLQILKEICLKEMQAVADWDSMHVKDGKIMKAVKAAVDAKCEVCTKEVLFVHWPMEELEQRVKTAIRKVPTPFDEWDDEVDDDAEA